MFGNKKVPVFEPLERIVLQVASSDWRTFVYFLNNSEELSRRETPIIPRSSLHLQELFLLCIAFECTVLHRVTPNSKTS